MSYNTRFKKHHPSFMKIHKKNPLYYKTTTPNENHRLSAHLHHVNAPYIISEKRTRKDGPLNPFYARIVNIVTIVHKYFIHTGPTFNHIDVHRTSRQSVRLKTGSNWFDRRIWRRKKKSGVKKYSLSIITPNDLCRTVKSV